MPTDTDDPGLRSNFERGSVADVTRRAQWKGAGLTDEDLEKSKIAVVNSSSELAICFRHLDDVAEVSPEAAVGGQISLVEDGDTVTVDVDEKRLDLELDPDELARRREAAGEPELPASSGWLSIYQRAVQPMSTGAVPIDRDPDGSPAGDHGTVGDG